MQESRILVIDDDAELCELLSDYLQREGFIVETVHNGPSGLARARVGGMTLIILDVMLPGMNGFDVLRYLRAESRIPVLMLTARGDDVDRIVGLELGADDYLAKPFNPRELVARIRAIQRRIQPTNAASLASQKVLEVGDLRLDAGNRVVRLGEQIIDLTSAEFTLLEVLMRAAGEVCTRDALAQKVLGRPFSPYDRSLDVHISSLRKKLEPYADGTERIRTLRGVGYQFALPS